MRRTDRDSLEAHAGFSIIEVLVATAVVTVGVASLAQLFVASARATRLARTISTTLLLAEGRMEQLRSETGLRASPSDALSLDTPGYVDYLGPSGVSLAIASVTPPPETAYVCRWSVTQVPDSPATAVVVQVLVTPWPRAAGQTRLVSVKTRTAR